ncbi:MAG: hypothetical protein RLY31_1078 [Bacteroidota bacterium]
MKFWIVGCFPFLLACSDSEAQTPLSGVINHYAQVLFIDSCTAQMTVDDPTGFEPGDQVLLMQMKGATIDASNSATFGQVTDVGGAGRFERNEILAVNGTNLTLRYECLFGYDADHAVQLVTFPIFQGAMVDAPLLAAPWDGQTGGVLALQVQGTLSLAADVDVSGTGFRGGQVSVVNSGCNFLVGISGYYYETGNWRGAAKGEGIAEFIPGRENGRGPQANGGGGGNDHNTGGGGGGLLTAGGQGGEQSSNTPFGCQGDFPGRGGRALQGFGDRLFLGGGGGSGHSDDTGAGSSGGNGGGIVILLADTILVPDGTRTISADGQSASLSPGDGAGGGGGAGMVLLSAEVLSGDLAVHAAGGHGGNASNSANRCFGPGGGGAGGLVATNLASLLTVHVTGGAAGVNTVPSGQCAGPSNGASPGTDGILLASAPLVPGSATPFLSATLVTPPKDTAVCTASATSFTVAAAASDPLFYQWQMDVGGGWADIDPSSPEFAGSLTDTLQLFSAGSTLDGAFFRCLVSNSCGDTLRSPAAMLTVLPQPVASFDLFLDDATVSFTNTSSGATGFSWDFGDGNASSETNPVHTYADQGVFLVSLAAWSACDTVFADTILQLIPTPDAGFDMNASPVGCAPLVLTFQDTSVGNVSQRLWSFPGGTPASSPDAQVTVTYLQSGTFDVGLAVGGPGGADTLLLPGFVTVADPPSADFESQADGLTVTFSNLSVGGTSWYWDFGDGGFSTAVNPVHTYASPGTYSVTLAAYNEYCGNALAQDLSVQTTNGSQPTSSLRDIRVFPNPARQQLFIQVDGEWPAAGWPARLLDVLGREQRAFELRAGRHALSVTDLPTGMYWLVVRPDVGPTLRFPVRLYAE